MAQERQNLLRRGWEALAHLHLATWIAETISGHWGIAVSGAASIGLGYWAWILQWGYLPVVLVALGVFATGIWALNGILWLARQRRPSQARVAFDYSYGIALDEVIPSHDPNNVDNSLEFRFQIRNVAPGPIKYHAERIDIIVDDDRIRTVRDIKGVLPRNSWVLLKVGGFTKAVVDFLPDRTKGSYEYSISYGHPNDKFSHRTKKQITFDLIKHEGKVTGAPWIIREETDEAISSP